MSPSVGASIPREAIRETTTIFNQAQLACTVAIIVHNTSVDLKIGDGMHVIPMTSSCSTHDGRGSRGTNGSSGDWVVTYGTVTSTPRTLNNKPAVRSEDSWRNSSLTFPTPYSLLSSLLRVLSRETLFPFVPGERYGHQRLQHPVSLPRGSYAAAISPLHTFSSDPHPLRQHDLIMSSQDLHQVILRWPYTDANEVSVTGTFDKPEWKTSLHLTRKPDGFEAPPIYVPWRNKFAYKFVVDGRWVTNDAEPTEVAPGGFVNNVYTAPPKPVLPEPEPSTAPPSYHSESEVEHEPAEKVADKPTANGTVLHVVRDTPTPTPDAAPEQHPRVPDVESDVIVDSAPEAVQETVAPVVEAAQAAFSQVAPAPIKVEKAADEITSESEAPKDSPSPAASEQPIQIPVPELAPNVPIGILPNSTPGSPSQDSTPTTRVDSEREVSTHVPLRFGSDTAVPQVEEEAPAPESVSRLEDATPAPVEAPEETTPAPVEEEREPEEATTAPVEEGEPEETTPAPVEEEGEPEGTTPAPVEDIDWKAAVLSEHKETTPALVEEKPEETTSALVEDKPEEPTPVLVEVESPKEEALAPAEVEGTAVPEPAPAPPTEPVHVPAAAKEPESAPPQVPEEVTPPASQEPAGVPEPSSQPAPEPVPEAKAEVAVVQVPAPEATPVAEPAPVVEATPTKAPVAAPEPTPQVAPAVNGHSKTVSGASTSTAAPTLPETVGRKTSRKFSFPGHGKDKSGNSSPTGSSRFASQQKREKRHSLLHKLKEIFSDKGKKKSEAKA